MDEREILLVYDDECPACDNYCRMVRVRESVGVLRLVNAREPGEVMDEITALGWDIDQGMVLKVKDRLFYGPDAIHALALLGSPSSMFNRLNYWLFSSEWRAKFFYPLLRTCRNVLLKVLRKTKINNLQIQGNQRF
ncbi:MAG: DCC1-like thiol-disulfide oxidoreductase family protein [Pseudomonadota bacterium]